MKHIFNIFNLIGIIMITLLLYLYQDTPHDDTTLFIVVYMCVLLVLAMYTNYTVNNPSDYSTMKRLVKFLERIYDYISNALYGGKSMNIK